ncbi:MAG: peroxidase-related enzyme [Terriglobia bacterium]
MGDTAKVQAVLKDYRTAPIREAEKALFQFLDKVNRQSHQISLVDVDQARRAGWSDEALYDAIGVCAQFNYYNRWIDATGVQDMPAIGYQMSGHRLATEGYGRPPAPASDPGLAKSHSHSDAPDANRYELRTTAKKVTTEPMFLREVEEREGGGQYADLIRQMRAAGAPVSQIFHLFAFKPAMTDHLSYFTQELMRGSSPLSPGLRELIAAFTSHRNHCPYCANSHAAAAGRLLANRELVQSVLENYQASALSPAKKALFGFIEKVTQRSWEIRRPDVDAIRQAGWSDEALYDAITVCALFNFYNRWVHAAGVHAMPPEWHEVSGKRLAERGYVLR